MTNDTICLSLLRSALKEQYHAGLAMLAQCIEKCPDDLWTAYAPPRPYWRAYWRIAFHAVYFTHLYMGQNLSAYQPWPDCPVAAPDPEQEPWGTEPYDLPEGVAAWTQSQLLDYLRYVDGIIDSTIDALDLETGDTGIPWYGNKMGKLSHEMLTIRHVQGHVGQLSELLMERDIDIDWVSRG